MVKFEIYKPNFVRFVPARFFKIRFWISQFWFKALVVGFGLYVFFNKDITFQFRLSNLDTPVLTEAMRENGIAQSVSNPSVNVSTLPVETVIANLVDESEIVTTNANPVVKKNLQDRTANNFSNIGFLVNPNYAQRNKVDPSVVAYHKKVCTDYVKRFAKVAILEQQKFGIPASITLAQGLLESNAGESRLSLESNNHFGIKCRSKCKGCTCRNYTDDSVYDMFRVFDSAWESYRAHSTLLIGDRYKHLMKLKQTDYKNWAYGLKKAGYATDSKYPEKLIAIIETLQLYRFDQMAIKG